MRKSKFNPFSREDTQRAMASLTKRDLEILSRPPKGLKPMHKVKIEEAPSDYDWNWHGGCVACEFGACDLKHA